MSTNRIDRIFDDISKEILEATTKFGPFNSTHEGYAVILEELDELWDLIKTKGASEENMRAEAIQVAAMAMRFIIDCIDEETD